MSSLIWENQSISRGTFGGAFPALPSLHTKLSFPKTMGLNFSQVELLSFMKNFTRLRCLIAPQKVFFLSVNIFAVNVILCSIYLISYFFFWKEIIIVKSITRRNHFPLHGFLNFTSMNEVLKNYTSLKFEKSTYYT